MSAADSAPDDVPDSVPDEAPGPAAAGGAATDPAPPAPPQPARPGTTGGSWWPRLGLLAFCLAALATIWVTNQLLSQRFTETVRNRAEVRYTLYVGQLVSELQRNSIVPQFLARDPEFITALETADYSRSTLRLIDLVDEIGAASIMLLDRDGRVVAATERTRIGEIHQNADFLVQALRSNSTVFTVAQLPGGGFDFVHSRRIDQNGRTLGVIVVEVDLARLERSWAGTQDAVMVLNSGGTIILATERRWRGLDEGDALSLSSPTSSIERALRITRDWSALPADAYLAGTAVMRRELRVPFQGWRLIGFTETANVRERVNGILALEIMGFAILLALAFWVTSRRTASRLGLVQRESEELRALNARLSREIAERQRMERSLEVAEQTIAQSSKLAVLGEMSAAVSHELNQPLAAMKTYLAGARLLLQRRRPEEALASFQRIDDLIDRMGAITRQLKSYARKGAEAFEPFDVRDAVSSALAMMEPQLKSRKVTIRRTLPDGPAMVLGDRLRLEQVIVNLLRNALDAVKARPDPRVEIILVAGQAVSLTVRDNGHGIEDLDALFEPFYTTKAPGDGVGLGLAISSGIVADLGGRLTARNAPSGGAVFEVALPSLGTRAAPLSPPAHAAE